MRLIVFASLHQRANATTRSALDNQLALVKQLTRIQRTALATRALEICLTSKIPHPARRHTIEPELLTKAEAAQLLGVSIRSIDNMMRQRRISFVKLTAKMVRFPRREILQHIREHLTVHAQGLEGR